MTIEISDQTVRLSDLVAGLSSSVLEGLVARNVHFVGPAVLALLPGSGHFLRVKVAEPFEGVFWELEKGRRMVTGAIGIRDFSFEDCSFESVGFAVHPDDAHSIAQLFTYSPR